MKYVLFICAHNAGRSQEEIRACADAILDRYDDVPIRSHVVTLANRAVRDCLEREHCDVLAAC